MEKKEELKSLFIKMMQDLQNIPQTDEIYQVDVKDFGLLNVNWKIGGMVGYQIFAKDKISYKFGESLDDPDVTIVIKNKDLALEFLKDEILKFTFAPGHNDSFKLYKTIDWKIIDTDQGKKRTRKTKPFLTAYFNKKKNHHPFILTKLPMFRTLVQTLFGDDDYGVFIPINQSLGTFENQVMPVKVFKHFINKASNIVMLYNCPCRRINDCKDHNKSYGCMYMGDDTLNILMTTDKGRVATKEEALERVKLAVEDGLIPLLGRAMDEAEGFGVEDTGHFLSMCFCCPCCCIDGKILTNASVSVGTLFKRMEGVTVKVDEDICVGCEECLEVCVFRGMEMIDGIAQVNQERCLGCGRCESTCPNEAISIEISDPSFVDGVIKKLESHVEVS